MDTAILSNRNFPGKLLLIGEHSVIEGSGALVIPYPDVSANLVLARRSLVGEDLLSNRVLNEFARWLKENKDPALPDLDMIRLFRDTEQGLYFRSSIPKRYGLGSSGALCAAVYNEYAEGRSKLSNKPETEELLAVKKTFACMESWFHGTSSGIDPLCIYYGKPLIIEGKESIKTWQIEDWKDQDLHAFLIDTGLTGDTGELVGAFRNKLQGESLKESFTQQYIPLVNEVVDQFADGRPDYESLVQLSLFQWRIFQDMIPEKFRMVWQYGLDWEYYTCKLLGSGGGGYLLGFTQDFDYARRCLLERFDLEPVYLNIW
jgi:mevalonate kinase